MKEPNTIRYPKILIIGQTIGGLFVFGAMGYASWLYKNSDILWFIGIFGIPALLLILTYYHWIEFNAEEITFHRFPFPTRTISWNRIQIKRGRRYQMFLALTDEFGKNVGSFNYFQEGGGSFFEHLRSKRPDLFALPEGTKIRKQPVIIILFMISLWFIFAIFSFSIISLNAGRVFTVIYVCGALTYIFKGVLEIKIEKNLITIKRAFSERTFRADEISSIGFVRKFYHPAFKDIGIKLNNGKTIRVILEGHNMLILYNQLSLWLENQQVKVE